MKVSSRGEYALRALLSLAQQNGAVLPISAIAEKTLVPFSYLEQIMLQLKNLGYVKSRRGVKGGYALRQSPSEINIGDVIRRLEGPLAPMNCASVTAYEQCPLEAECMLKPLWTLVRDTVSFVLDQTTLDDLVKRNLKGIEGVKELVKET
ncbi:Rrf2 family transcriptional regulator [Brevibacillus fluminis]|uniref:Rrf2 family transcriptional regulator n=1 Tax=Brevibacillus fluminis TaxID=511487 RepID=A0A3M8DB84_9BACL|nr:Rrf2 family transcriptional regulator [Brevibacillus fluminis]RNB85400.1 Rrf2 family transcriptional regulator [Brevibacillus fluminis]